MDFRTKLYFAQTVAREAALLLKDRANMQVQEKHANDFVTALDKKSETLIRKRLLSAFPEDAFFGEESGRSENVSGGIWIVDPIDGTQSFLRGQHGYCISIAYEYDHDLKLGCVYAPDTDEMFTALRGEGAWLNDIPIHVSDIHALDHALCHFGYGHRDKSIRNRTVPVLHELIEHISDLRRLGTAAYALCNVACGRSDAFFELGLFPYDIAAGVLIVEEAGGTCTAWDEGQQLFPACNILATNGHIHEALRSYLK